MDSKPLMCFEVEKVLGVSSDGNYQVQWAPAWVSKFHLVGCEHLIQECLQQQKQEQEQSTHQLKKKQQQQQHREAHLLQAKPLNEDVIEFHSDMPLEVLPVKVEENDGKDDENTAQLFETHEIHYSSSGTTELKIQHFDVPRSELREDEGSVSMFGPSNELFSLPQIDAKDRLGCSVSPITTHEPGLRTMKASRRGNSNTEDSSMAPVSIYWRNNGNNTNTNDDNGNKNSSTATDNNCSRSSSSNNSNSHNNNNNNSNSNNNNNNDNNNENNDNHDNKKN